MENNCVFCKIAKGEIPSYKLYENNEVLAFLDITPYAKGHTLVIPKKHSRWVWDIHEEEYTSFMLEIKKVAEILKKAFNTDCVQQVIAGFGVPHTHIHLFPRTKDDGLPEIPKERLLPKLSDQKMQEITEKIRKYV
jgi:histidine triad (HIT) family protein